ncbi:aminotransferase [Hyphococcus flavus]|uniref:Aminotransferase n=1 Tax=Hyphococcus flavus TaxID=1866326 RepID=A0AAF0CEU4_9PROT|nr:aminotransferase [Hyphococcus flavus]WDI30103.1 aminotransferase [Hyphococcus flavus]
MTKTPASTAALQLADKKHHAHPFTDPKALAENGSRIISRGKGVEIWDNDGNKYLDGMAGLWCVNIGYGRNEIAERVKSQIEELCYYNSFFMSATPTQIELAETISSLTPEGLNHIFFGTSGSDANDTASRLVRHYWDLKGKPTKKTIISLIHAYHGSTITGASLGGWPAMHKMGSTLQAGYTHIMPPYWFEFGRNQSKEDFGLKAAQALEDAILLAGADNIAAFIAEPVMGAGGVIPAPDTYWPMVQEICKKHDVLLIADEVITGFGRTGEWFGSFTYNIKPDILNMAKGLSSGYAPISATAVSDDMYAVLSAGGEISHGFTYSGHPVCCAAALENIRIMKDEKIVEYVRDVAGPHFQNKLQEFADHPLVGEARGVGLLGALELVRDPKQGEKFAPEKRVAIRCVEKGFENGIIMRAIREVLEFSPPLIITTQEIDLLFDRARYCIDEVAKEEGIL